MTATQPLPVRPFDRRLPPVVPLGMAALALAVVGGVVTASQVGSDPAPALPGTFVAAAGILEVVAVVTLATIRPFAWERFRRVFLVALAAYVAQAAIIEWAFVRNDVPTSALVVLTGGLVVFATIVPLMIAFTVARYQAVDDEGNEVDLAGDLTGPGGSPGPG